MWNWWIWKKYRKKHKWRRIHRMKSRTTIIFLLNKNMLRSHFHTQHFNSESSLDFSLLRNNEKSTLFSRTHTRRSQWWSISACRARACLHLRVSVPLLHILDGIWIVWWCIYNIIHIKACTQTIQTLGIVHMRSTLHQTNWDGGNGMESKCWKAFMLTLA